jgi:hypothetical protein
LLAINVSNLFSYSSRKYTDVKNLTRGVACRFVFENTARKENTGLPICIAHNDVLLMKSLLKSETSASSYELSRFLTLSFVTSADGKWQKAVEQVLKIPVK